MSVAQALIEGAELTVPTEAINLGKKAKRAPKVAAIKRGKGRPNIHPLAGRTYLLKEEVVSALEAPAALALLLQDAHEISEERRAVLEAAGFLKNPDNIEITMNGHVVDTIERAISLGNTLSTLGYNISYKISKERLVPNNAKNTEKGLVIAPTYDNLEINGKKVKCVVKDEFSPTRIYVYIVAAK